MKYYQLREFETSHLESHDGVVSRKELKRRLSLIRLIREWKGNLDAAVDILLHGDKPQDEVLQGDGENQHDLPGCEDEAGPNW